MDRLGVLGHRLRVLAFTSGCRGLWLWAAGPILAIQPYHVPRGSEGIQLVRSATTELRVSQKSSTLYGALYCLDSM